MQVLSKLYRLLLCFLLLPALVFAQGVTTAALNGTVVDNKGQPLVGANVTAVHEPSGSFFGSAARSDGHFNIPGLRVGGPYTITASFIGYQTQKQGNVYLALGQDLKINFVLPEEAVEVGEVQIVAERDAIMSASRTGAATNVLREQIDRLPTISRSFQDYYKLSPYFTGVGSQAAGRNNRYNNIQVDGANFNDLFGLGATGTPGGQGGTVPISLDAIEEFQIVVSPFDVRQSNFTGAGINAITRSGTNAFKGSVFYNTRNEDFSGESPDALKAKLPPFTNKSYGFRLGGPIIENQFFFFVNAELARADAPFTRAFNQPAFGTDAYTANEDSLNMLSDFLRTQYGYETGSWRSIKRPDESDKLFARLDYNLSNTHKLTARWNYLNSTTQNSPSRFRGTPDIYSANSDYDLKNKTHSFALQLTSVLSNTASNELSIGYNNQLDQPTFRGQPFPTVEVRTYGPGGTLNRLAVGSEEFRHRNELEQKVLEITNNFSYYLPAHKITVGAKVDFIKFRNLFIPDNFGFYQYNSVAAFLAGGRPAVYAHRYSATGNPLQEANWGYQQFGFYVQDEWTVSPRFNLVGGVRFDIPNYTDKPNNNDTFETVFGLKTSEPPKTSVAVSPRFGFNWAVDEERNTQVRGGAGVFYGRFPAVWVSNQYSNTGVDFFTMTASTAGAPTTFNPDPFNQPKTATGLPTAEVNITDRNFKAPSILRFNLAVDRRLPFDLVASVEGIFSSSQNEVYYQNINLAGLKENNGITPGGKLVRENREVWSNINTTGNAIGTYNSTGRVVSTRFTAAYLVRNTDQGSNTNIIVQLQRQSLRDGLYGNIGYVWGRARDIGGTNSTTASSGWRFNPTPGNPNNPDLAYADADRRHRVFGTVSYRLDWGKAGLRTTIGLFYNGISGRPFSYIVQGDVNGDGLSDNDLAYIPRDQSDIILVTSAGAPAPQSDYDALFAFINKDEYLSKNKGKIAERNGARSAWESQIDLRIAQDIGSLRGHKVELTFDVTNFGNLLNHDWGWVRQASQQVALVTFHSVQTTGSDAGRPRYRWTSVTDPRIASNSLSRWTAQFGIRYTL
jgi:hypothetical protein